MYVCICAAVKKAEIEKELHNGATLEDLRTKLGVANDCCKCLESLKSMLSNKYEDESLNENS